VAGDEIGGAKIAVPKSPVSQIVRGSLPCPLLFAPMFNLTIQKKHQVCKSAINHYDNYDNCQSQQLFICSNEKVR